ncbi:MAG: hypothetical protein K0Q59_291 [Paenibacillus sp.]|jgi:hypothetical protein|nr:hypothetical protein [Paenibacillus sp.]
MSATNSPCEQLFAYFLGELAGEEKQAFQMHLTVCPSCREELDGLRQVWDALPYTMPQLELPEQIKEEVLGAVIHSEKDRQPVPRTERNRKRSWMYATAIALVVLVGSAGWIEAIRWRGETLRPIEQAIMPAEVMQQISLKPFDPSIPQAGGQVWLTSKGGQIELVMHASGLPVLQGEQAYQVWLIKNGDRHNGGTFRVDSQGNGVLTYRMSEDVRQFEAIGITLEPDAAGTKPRGKKVLGT